MNKKEMLKNIQKKLSDKEIEEYFDKIDKAQDLILETLALNKINLSVVISALGRVYVEALYQGGFTNEGAEECTKQLLKAYKERNKDGK